MSLYRQVLETYLKTITVKCHSAIDIGGSAYPVSGRVGSWKVKQYDIVDNNSEKDWHDKWSKPAYLFDIESAKLPPTLTSKYEIAFMLEVAEYLINPLQALTNVYGMLEESGLFYSSWPTLYGLHNPYTLDSLRYTKFGLKRLFESAGFNIIDIVPRKVTVGLAALRQFYGLEGMRVAKGLSEVYDAGYIIKAVKPGVAYKIGSSKND